MSKRKVIFLRARGDGTFGVALLNPANRYDIVWFSGWPFVLPSHLNVDEQHIIETAEEIDPQVFVNEGKIFKPWWSDARETST